MSKIAERYSTARHTSNLKSEPRTSMSAADVLTAAGWTAQEHTTAMALWEVAFKGKTGAKHALCDMLERALTAHMARAGLKGHPRTITQSVVAWWLHGTCQPCGGRRYQTVPGAPHLSDMLCKHCGGTGKIAHPNDDAFLWLKDYMDRLSAMAGGQVMRRLARDMEL